MVLIAGKSWFILTLVSGEVPEREPNVIAYKDGRYTPLQYVFYKEDEADALDVDGVYRPLYKYPKKEES